MKTTLEVITWNVQRLFSPSRSRLAASLGAKWSEAAFETKLTRVAAELLVVANHWPSRLLPEGEAFRLAAAGEVSRRIQAWSERRRAAIVLGDLNDEPGDASVRAVLGATRERPAGKLVGKLWNPGWALLGGERGPSGSCFFGGDAWLFDQMVVSDALIGGGAISWDAAAFRVAGAAELGEAGKALLNRSGRPVGFEPTRGTGVSDHLPVVGRIGIAA